MACQTNSFTIQWGQEREAYFAKRFGKRDKQEFTILWSKTTGGNHLGWHYSRFMTISHRRRLGF